TVGFRLRFCRWIRQRKDDWSLDLARHFTNDRLREGSADRGQPDKNGCVDFCDYVRKSNGPVRSSRPPRDAVCWLSVNTLLGAEVLAPRILKAVLVNDPELPAGLLLG